MPKQFRLINDADNTFFVGNKFFASEGMPANLPGVYTIGDISISTLQVNKCVGWVYTAEGWEEFGQKGEIEVTVDLSAYATRDEMNQAIADAVSKMANNSTIIALQKEIQVLGERQQQIIYALELKGISIGTVEGKWQDMLFDRSKMEGFTNIRVQNNNIIIIDPLQPGEVRYKEIVIGFLASAVEFAFDIDMSFKEAKAVQGLGSSLSVKSYTYDFDNTVSRGVERNVK